MPKPRHAPASNLGATHQSGKLRPDEIETPAALIDPVLVERHLDRVALDLQRSGIAWRPHVKTHKSATLARAQIQAGARGLTVATPREAEVMASVTSDLLLAHPPVGAKVERVAALAQHADLKVALDDSVSLDALGAELARHGNRLEILVEVDVGMGRVGVRDPSSVVALASRAANHGHMAFAGILYYPGHIRGPAESQHSAIDAVNGQVAAILGALEAAGLPARIVSGGSTPTLPNAHRFGHLTEFRAGTCVFHDRASVSMGLVRPDEVAFTILATVVSTDGSGRVTVDAGSKALAKETFRGSSGDEGGFGMLVSPAGHVVSGLSEEHGIVRSDSDDWQPAVGDRVRIIPNHVCVAVNLQDRLLALRPDGCYDVVPLEARGRGLFEGSTQHP